MGLKNGGATCYMNAVFQQLFMQPSIRALVLGAQGGAARRCARTRPSSSCRLLAPLCPLCIWHTVVQRQSASFDLSHWDSNMKPHVSCT